MIRRATSEDSMALTPLFIDYLAFYQKTSFSFDRVLMFLFDRITRDESVVFIAQLENAFVGFIQLYPTFSSLQLKRAWIVNDLYVIPSHRKKGIAKQLLAAAKMLATQTMSAYLSLSTQHENSAARTLYERSGWELDTAFCHFLCKMPSPN